MRSIAAGAWFRKRGGLRLVDSEARAKLRARKTGASRRQTSIHGRPRFPALLRVAANCQLAMNQLGWSSTWARLIQSLSSASNKAGAVAFEKSGTPSSMISEFPATSVATMGDFQRERILRNADFHGQYRRGRKLRSMLPLASSKSVGAVAPTRPRWRLPRIPDWQGRARFSTTTLQNQGVPSVVENYNPAHPRSRKSLGEIIRKLSVTELQNSAHLLGTSSRRNSRVVSANSPQVP